MICFTVPGKPVGKQRPRTFQANGRTRTITPQKTKDYEEIVKWCYYRIAKNEKFDGAVSVYICVFVKPPKSQKTEYPTQKPDVDNIAKTILDALNGIAWGDDSQVCELTIKKRFGEEDGVSVSINKMDE